MKIFGLSGPDLPCYFVASDPGNIVIFDQRIFHTVYGMQPVRRFLKYRFVARPETDEQVASIMQYNDKNQIYRPDDAFLNSDRLRIRAMVDPFLKLTERTKGWVEAGKV